jgi:hypothetical protein
VSDTYGAVKAKQAIRQRHVIWRRHALERMLERGLSRKVVLAIAEIGEIIEDYSADRPVPTVLLFGWDGKRPVHVVLAIEPDGQVAIITAYEPTLDVFESDYRTRRKP